MTDLISNEPNCAEILSAAGTLLTTVFAGIALYGWKDQKTYEVRMEALSKSRSAVELVFTLRNPGNYPQKIKENIEKEDKLDVISDIEIFERLLKTKTSFYEDIIRTREIVWASLGPKHKYTIFYTEVTDIIERVKMAHFQRRDLVTNKTAILPENTKLIQGLSKITHYQGKDDQIHNHITYLQEDMNKREPFFKFLTNST